MRFLPPSARGMSGRAGSLACWRCTISPLAIHEEGRCTAVARVVPFLSCQRLQLRGRLLGVHAAPAWLSALLLTVYQWQQRLLFPHSFGHCLDQFLSWPGGISVPLLDARMAWLGPC